MHTIMQNICHEKWTPFLSLKHASISEGQHSHFTLYRVPNCTECGLVLFFILYYTGSFHHCFGLKTVKETTSGERASN